VQFYSYFFFFYLWFVVESSQTVKDGAQKNKEMCPHDQKKGRPFEKQKASFLFGKK